METKKFFGNIFLPESPNNKILDIWLFVTDEDIYVEVPARKVLSEKNEIILGEFNGIGKVSFINCYSGAYFSGSIGFYQKINISFYIENLHIKSLNDLKFTKASFTSPTLLDWIYDYQGIEIINNQTFKISNDELIAEVKNEDLNIKINIGHSIKRLSNKELKVNMICKIHIEYENLMDINFFNDVILQLKKLILFLTNRNPNFSPISFQNFDTSCGLIINSQKLNDQRFSQGINIGYSDVKKNFSNVIDNWLNLEKLKPTIDLVLEKNYNTDMSIQGFFLSVCMSIEILQTKFGKYKTPEILDAQIANNKKTIESLIDDGDLKKWFLEKTQFLDKPTLQNRLLEYKEIFEVLKNEIFEMEIDAFIKKITKSRNKIVHEGNSNKYFDEMELFFAAKIIEFTIRLEIMKLLGININGKPSSLIENAHDNLVVLYRINSN